MSTGHPPEPDDWSRRLIEALRIQPEGGGPQQVERASRTAQRLAGPADPAP